MPKIIKIVVTGTIELPDAAEIIRFRDGGGLENDHVKFKGRIIRPEIGWLEYFTADIMLEKDPDEPADMGYETLDHRVHNKYFLCNDEEWFMEEAPPLPPSAPRNGSA